MILLATPQENTNELREKRPSKLAIFCPNQSLEEAAVLCLDRSRGGLEKPPKAYLNTRTSKFLCIFA